MTKIKIGIIAALLAAAGFLFWQNRALIEEKAKQAATIVQQQAEIQDREKRIKDLARQREAAEAAAAREKARAVEIRKEAKELKNEMARLEKENQEISEWADARMPDAVYDRLRDATAHCQD